jgi:hypothetical protein
LTTNTAAAELARVLAGILMCPPCVNVDAPPEESSHGR